MPKKRLYLIDGSGFYYRAYYGIRQNLTAPDGTPTNAVYGFVRMLKKILDDERPDRLAIALDSREKTFRHEMFPEYKANRQEMPEDLAVQLPYIERIIDASNVRVLKRSGVEADDLIGTAAIGGVKAGYDVTIVSGDKDFMQLVSDEVRMFDPLKEKWYDADGVREKFGVEPGRVVEMLGLMGDASDNIPGVPGVGAKTAQKLLEQYHDIDNLLAHAGEVKQPKLRQSLIEQADKARLSRELARIKTDLEGNADFDAWTVADPDRDRLHNLLVELDFRSFFDAPPKPTSAPAVETAYKAVTTEKELKQLVSRLKASSGFALDTETTSTEPMKARLVGLSFSTSPGEGFYIPVAHDYEGAPPQLDKAEVLKALAPVLKNKKIEKYGQNIKYDLLVLEREGVEVGPVSFDTMLASYLVAPEERRHNIGVLARTYLGRGVIEYAEVAGKGAKEIPFNQVMLEAATPYAAEDAEVAYALTGVLKEELKREGMEELYYGLELPLIRVLARMERNGIALDGQRMKEYGNELEKELEKTEKDIHRSAGEEFNIASPKQLSAILFDKLKLTKVRKTKTGSSTDQKVLETLSLYHELPALVLRHRQLAKLKSTYVDPLPLMISEETGRIHTSFNQTTTATGRLSSSSPNLQNLPVRTEEGRKIREAFHAAKGHLLVSADYSQIELRIMAHLSRDSLLTESFANDEDVHRRTALEIFGSLSGEPTGDMRRAAKAVNFGIIYGQTAFGLARELRITRSEAQGYIDSYFDRYRGVKEFIEMTIEGARKDRFVTTMAGRKRRLPDIASSNRTARELAERMAVNTVVQGSAADLIKKAMLSLDDNLRSTKTKMLLQVHDELIFETPKGERDEACRIVRKEMEAVERLSVPLKVSVESGSNWGELH